MMIILIMGNYDKIIKINHYLRIAIIKSYDLIVLDEHTSALAIKSKRKILEILKIKNVRDLYRFSYFFYWLKECNL